MSSINEIIEFVKDQASFHEKKAAEFDQSSPRRSERHKHAHDVFLQTLDVLIAQQGQIEALTLELSKRPPVPKEISSRQVQLRLEDLEGLPDELINELSITDGDRMDFTVQAVINEAGGVASLDQVLIALYRKTQEVHKRANINSRLYRLASKGELHAVPGKKGVYATRQLSEDEVKSLA